MPVTKFDFQKLWDNYPNGELPEVADVIGGAVGGGLKPFDAAGNPLGWIKNTCTIRMSHAFNAAGVSMKIPQSHAYADGKNPKNMMTISGKGGRYAFRVAEFLRFLRERFGKPTIREFKARGDANVPASFKGQKGVIVFNDCGWSDATGHVDLWNGETCKHHGYWEQAKEVYLWTPTGGVWAVGPAVNGQVLNGATPVVTVTPH